MAERLGMAALCNGALVQEMRAAGPKGSASVLIDSGRSDRWLPDHFTRKWQRGQSIPPADRVATIMTHDELNPYRDGENARGALTVDALKAIEGSAKQVGWGR